MSSGSGFQTTVGVGCRSTTADGSGSPNVDGPGFLDVITRPRGCSGVWVNRATPTSAGAPCRRLTCGSGESLWRCGSPHIIGITTVMKATCTIATSDAILSTAGALGGSQDTLVRTAEREHARAEAISERGDTKGPGQVTGESRRVHVDAPQLERLGGTCPDNRSGLSARPPVGDGERLVLQGLRIAHQGAQATKAGATLAGPAAVQTPVAHHAEGNEPTRPTEQPPPGATPLHGRCGLGQAERRPAIVPPIALTIVILVQVTAHASEPAGATRPPTPVKVAPSRAHLTWRRAMV